MTRHIIIVALLITMMAGASAQKFTQTDSSTYNGTRIIPVDKANLLKNIDVIFNMQYADNNRFSNGIYTGSNFAMNQLRLEIKGQILENVFFRFRERFTREPVPQTVDNIDHSLDDIFITVDLSKKWSLTFGKMSTNYGGYEFVVNPIYIYQYNDIIANSDNYLSGAGATWNMSKDHSFSFQVLNARTQTYAQIYDTIPGVTPSKFPVAYVGNWKGVFEGGKFATNWSYTIISEASHKYVYYAALGNQLHLKKWLVQYDFKYNPMDIDRIFVVTSIIPKNYSPYTALNTKYIEHWLNVVYTIDVKWKATIVGMTSDAYWYGNQDPKKNSHLRTAYGIIPAMEFYPFKTLNLKFFAAYVGRYYNYTNYSKTTFGSANSTTGVMMMGFITPLNVL